MKDRDFHHRKAVKTNSVFHWACHRKLRNTVNRKVKAAKSKYYCDLILEAKGDSGKIWKAVNEVSSSPQCIVVEGVEHTTPASIASLSPNFYSANLASVQSCLQHQLSPVLQTRSYCIWRMENCAVQCS